jgi:hypothetical protein
MRLIILVLALSVTGCAGTVRSAYKSCNALHPFSAAAECIRQSLEPGNRHNDYFLAKVTQLENQVKDGRITEEDARVALIEAEEDVRARRQRGYSVYQRSVQ